MKKDFVSKTAKSAIAAVLTVCVFFTVMLLPVKPVFAAAASPRENSPEADSVTGESIADGSTAAAESTESTSGQSMEQTETYRILKEYADTLETQYGKTYTAYLWNLDEKRCGERYGFDSTEIPASDAAFMISDYDQDGEAELLVVGIKEDSSLKLTMYEVTEDQKVSPAAAYDAKIENESYDSLAYAIEQGPGGFTHVFQYDKDGPCIGIDSSGFCYNVTGRRRIILCVKYDGEQFRQEAGPYFDTTSGQFDDASARAIRGLLEAFGTVPMMDADVLRVANGYPLNRYLPETHEIMCTGTKAAPDAGSYSEWIRNDSAGPLTLYNIYFDKVNELYDAKMDERFSCMLHDNMRQDMSFSDETNHSGTTTWTTFMKAYGKDGNLYKAGFSHPIGDDKAREDGVTFEDVNVSLNFWETEEGIYMLPELSEEEYNALLEHGTLPERSSLVYCAEERPDPLEQSVEGEHCTIKRVPISNYLDTVWYSGYRIPGKNLESRDCVTIIWKEDEGLQAYKYSRTPAGADLIRAWDPKYVSTEDLGFTVR